MATNGGNGNGTYRRERGIGGLFLLGLAGLLYLGDYISTEFQVDTIQLMLIFGTALALLAVAGAEKVLDKIR